MDGNSEMAEKVRDAVTEAFIGWLRLQPAARPSRHFLNRRGAGSKKAENIFATGPLVENRKES